MEDKGLGRGSPEFFFQSPEITPWSPIDSLAILKFIEFMSSNKALTEIELTSLLFSSTKENKLQHLIDETTFLRSKLNEISSKLNKNKFDKQRYVAKTSFFTPPNAGFYSNVFAVDSGRTASKNRYYWQTYFYLCLHHQFGCLPILIFQRPLLWVQRFQASQ